MKNYVQFFLTWSGTKTTSQKDFLATAYNFQDLNSKAFFNNPEGLGNAREITINKNGDFSQVVANNVSFQDIKGEIIFSRREAAKKGNYGSYEAFNYFNSFCKRSRLSLMYVLPNVDNIDDVVCREVVLSSIEKSEIDYKTGHLRCNVVFTPLTPWVRGKVNISHSGKSTYAYTSSSGFCRMSFKTVGNMETPISIRLDGWADKVKEITYDLYYKKGFESSSTKTRVGSGKFVLNSDVATGRYMSDLKIAFINNRWVINDTILADFVPDTSYRESARPFLFLYANPNTEYIFEMQIKGSDDYHDKKIIIEWDDYYDCY